MVLVEGMIYYPKTPINRENAEYNAALISYINIEFERERLRNESKELAKKIKRLAKEA